MPRTPRLIAVLAVANGTLTLLTASAFAWGGFGTFRPGDPGGFRSIAGFLVVFAALALIAFVGGGLVQLDSRSSRTGLILLAGLGLIDALANAVFIVASMGGFNVPANLHWLTASSSAFLSILATVVLLASEIPTRPEQVSTDDPWARPARLTAWPVSTIFGAAFIGGIATVVGVGRHEFAGFFGSISPSPTGPIVVTVVCLILFALGAGAVMATAFAGSQWLRRRRERSPTPSILILATTAVGALAIGVADAVRAANATGLTSSMPTPWSRGFWVWLALALASALALGAVFAGEYPARDLVPNGHRA